MSALSIIITTIVFLSTRLIWKRIKYIQNIWPARGVTLVGSDVTGNIFTIVYNRTLRLELDSKIYSHAKNTLKQPFVGVMEFSKPALFLTDLELIKTILVKDFEHFPNRRQLLTLKETDPCFYKMLFFMEDESWKELRSKISPTFTSGKIKRMFQLFKCTTDKLMEYLNNTSNNNNNEHDIDLMDAFERFTMDIIASTAFGIDSKAFSEHHSIFQEMGNALEIQITVKLMISVIIMVAVPKLGKILGLSLSDKKAQDFFTQLVLGSISHREKSGEVRDDFLQILLEAKNGHLNEPTDYEFESELEENQHPHNNKQQSRHVQLTNEHIIAQSIFFFIAGLETSTSTLLFCTYELALNPEIQAELFDEIEGCFLDLEGGGELTYEKINGLEYLDKVINETLRKYPPVPRLERRSKIDYKIPDTNISIPKDTLIFIPTYSIQHDEEYFPAPNKFDPERFNLENTTSRQQLGHSIAFQPFGHGQRRCLGNRFALVNIKLAIVNILHQFRLEPCQNTLIPMKFSKTNILKPQSMQLKLIPRKITGQ